MAEDDPLDALLLGELDDAADASALQLSSPVDDADLLLADLLLADSPTAQFSMFFAADDDAQDPVSGETSETTGDPASSATPAGRKEKRRRKRPATYNSNKARNERRHEIAYLRRKVADMEAELARVRDGNATALAVSANARAASARPVPQVPPGVWEQIAKRQQDERRRAETDNAKLRVALETQLKIAKSLEVVLNKRSIARIFEDCGLAVVANRVITNTIDEAAKAMLQALLQHVELIYSQADQLIDGGGVEPGVRTANSGSLVEVFATDLMPFALDAASKAAWEYFSFKKNQLPVPSRLYFERHNVENTSIEDTVIESSGMERIANGMTAIVKLKQVLRRYVEQDRVVIAWSALSQPIEFAGLPFSGYDLREWGCMVLRPGNATEQLEVDASSPLTVLRSCYFITPEFKGDEANGGDAGYDIGRLTECVLGFTAARMATWRQRIENILLDEQLAASRHPIPSTSILLQ